MGREGGGGVVQVHAYGRLYNTVKCGVENKLHCCGREREIERDRSCTASAALYTVRTARSEVVLTLGVSCSAAAAALAVRERACVRAVAEFSFLNGPYCLRFHCPRESVGTASAARH